jgi:ferrous iron transport protein A
MRKSIDFKFFRTLAAKPDKLELVSGPALGLQHRMGHGHGGSETEDGEMSLRDCHEGDLIVIRRIQSTGPLRRRLLEMGLNPGTPVRVVKYAPLKDPLECEIKGYHIALRVSEAGAIIVGPLIP